MTEHVGFELTVDGERRTVEDAWWFDSLLTVLRDRLGVRGPKLACGHGRCGACAVRVDGELTCACLMPAAAAGGCTVETIASVAGHGSAQMGQGGALTDVQEAFLHAGATQCGYCTPGFVLAATDLLERTPDPTPEQIREGLYGNVCRCTGYGRIVAAVEDVARSRRERTSR